MSENIANVDPETGISYGVIAINSLADWVLEEIRAGGSDLDYEEAQEEVGQAISNAIDHKNLSESQQEQVNDLINDIIAVVLENWEGSGDNVRYRYETEHEGAKLVVQTTSGGELFVFKSPVTQVVAQCSPCFPNAGDLDNPRPYDTPFNPEHVKLRALLPYGVPVKAYALPDEWLRKNED